MLWCPLHHPTWLSISITVAPVFYRMEGSLCFGVWVLMISYGCPTRTPSQLGREHTGGQVEHKLLHARLATTRTLTQSPQRQTQELSNNCHICHLRGCPRWGMPGTQKFAFLFNWNWHFPTIGLLWNQEIAAQIVHKFISVPPYSIYYKDWSAKEYGFSALYFLFYCSHLYRSRGRGSWQSGIVPGHQQAMQLSGDEGICVHMDSALVLHQSLRERIQEKGIKGPWRERYRRQWLEKQQKLHVMSEMNPEESDGNSYPLPPLYRRGSWWGGWGHRPKSSGNAFWDSGEESLCGSAFVSMYYVFLGRYEQVSTHRKEDINDRTK